jgi:hypothetical protein
VICTADQILFSDQIDKNETGGAHSTLEARRDAYRILVGKPWGKRPLGRPKCWWEDNIKTDLQDAGWGDMDWIYMDQNRARWRALVDVVMNFRVL